MKLIEITEEMFPKSRKEKREELKRIQQERGYQKGWVWHRMEAFDKKHEEKIKKLKEELEASTSLGKKNNWCKYRATQNDKCHDCKICNRINKSLLSNGFISIKNHKKSVDYGDNFGGLKDVNENVIHRFVSLKSFQSLPTLMNPSQNCVIEEFHYNEGVVLRFRNKYRNDHNGFNVLPRSIFRNKESWEFYEKVIYDFLYDLREHYSTSVRLIVNDKVCSLCDFIEHDLIEEELAI
jgi:ferredoxin